MCGIAGFIDFTKTASTESLQAMVASLHHRGPDDSGAETFENEYCLIGFGQALALVPGVSRSGITMTVAMALGLSREGAARFSFLLAIPALGISAGWQFVQFLGDPEPVLWGTLAVAVLVSAATAFLTIRLFLGLIRRMGMLVFALYRLILAGLIFYIFV